ncbi:hypothetical protein GQ600_658 [Phytophthora cactorum]|nr:hypothetical protein GQ600_658 [Phytophthora cactorum]
MYFLSTLGLVRQPNVGRHKLSEKTPQTDVVAGRPVPALLLHEGSVCRASSLVYQTRARSGRAPVKPQDWNGPNFFGKQAADGNRMACWKRLPHYALSRRHAAISTDSILTGCVGYIDGWLCEIRAPCTKFLMSLRFSRDVARRLA